VRSIARLPRELCDDGHRRVRQVLSVIPEPGGRQQPSLWSAIKTLHRLEVGPVYLFVLIWGMAVAARQPSDLWSAPAILAFLINGLSLFSGFVLTTTPTIRSIDAVRSRGTSPTPWSESAIENIGALLGRAGITVAAAAAAVSLLLHNWVFVVVKVAGIVSGMMYTGSPSA